MLSTEKISVVNIVFLRLNVTEIHTYFMAFKVDWKKKLTKNIIFVFMKQNQIYYLEILYLEIVLLLYFSTMH